MRSRGKHLITELELLREFLIPTTRRGVLKFIIYLYPIILYHPEGELTLTLTLTLTFRGILQNSSTLTLRIQFITFLLNPIINLKMPAPQYRYWILTIPHHNFLPFLPSDITFIKGQLERSHGTEYLHWQLLAHSKRKLTMSSFKTLFGPTAHVEPTRSKAAESYVWKEDTRVPNTQFQLGELPFKRNSDTDWGNVVELAKANRLNDLPADVLVRYYGNLKELLKITCNLLASNDKFESFGVAPVQEVPTGLG